MPCWWGITPGVTSWEEARQFFATFATEIIQGETTQINERGITYSETLYIPRYATGREPPSLAVGGFRVIYGGISSIQIGRLHIDYSIQLDQMLEVYGPPTQIFMKTFSNAPEFPLPFTLVLFYEDQGIMAIYDYDAERVGDVIRSCPMPVGTVLWLWSQIIEMDDGDIEFRALGPDPSKPLRLLEEVTDYTIDSFHQTFKDASNQTCIITPVEHCE